MPKYMIVYRTRTNERNFTIKANETWEGGVVDFDGDITEAAKNYARACFYHGDTTGIPSEYRRDIGESSDDIVSAYICLVEDMVDVDIQSMLDAHRAWHDQDEEEELKKKELSYLSTYQSEVVRIKQKYNIK